MFTQGELMKSVRQCTETFMENVCPETDEALQPQCPLVPFVGTLQSQGAWTLSQGFIL